MRCALPAYPARQHACFSFAFLHYSMLATYVEKNAWGTCREDLKSADEHDQAGKAE